MQAEIDYLLTLPTNFTYNDISLIGSSCQHIHVPRLSNESYTLVFHIITLASFIFNSFAIFAILTQSSVSMGNFRWCLFNLQVWSFLTDIMISVFAIPRFQFPIISGRCLGLFTFFGVSAPPQIFIGFGSLGYMTASVTVLFLYRHQVIVGRDSIFSLKRRNMVLIIIVNYLIYGNMALPGLSSAPKDQLAAKIKLLQETKCPSKDILHPDVFILQISMKLLFPYLVFLLSFVAFECLLLALHSSWILLFSTLKAKFSWKTRKLQIKFLIALVLQIAIPTALCYCPIFYWVITTYLDHYWQFANDVTVIVFSTHGTVSAVCLLLLYDSYRDFSFYCLRIICCCGCACFHKNQNEERQEGVGIMTHIRSNNSVHPINSVYIT